MGTLVLNRSAAILLAGVLALAGANAAQALGLLDSYLFLHQLPKTALFRAAFLGMWLPIAILAFSSGLWGGYLAIRTNSLSNWYLTVFTAAFCLVVKVDQFELGWSALRLAVTMGTHHVAVGLNAVGIALAVWLFRIRQTQTTLAREPLPPKPLPPVRGASQR